VKVAPIFTRELPAFTDLLAVHQYRPDIYPHLLESVAGGSLNSRYDILFAFPQERLVLDSGFRLHMDGQVVAESDFLDALDHWWGKLRIPPSGTGQHVPFRGGWFVYLGYELAQQIEPTLELPRPVGQLPVACAIRYPAALVRDHARRKTFAVAEPGYQDHLDRMCRDVRESAGLLHLGDGITSAVLREEDPERFLNNVRRLLRYIGDGDVFQVNLSRLWQIEAHIDGVALYDSLRRHNPAPFAALASFGKNMVLSSSPERLVRVSDERIETRPIAGTRPRGSQQREDEHLSMELLAHPKERSEHVMLIDLERNDLGRVCRPGTVHVNEFMALESYAHVHHIVSNVRGLIAREITPGDVIRAVFPGGTITGCPKVRCMEIIAELEQVPRGPYTGSLGYINRDRDMDLNILIRSLELDDNRVQLRAGAGIVADSVAEFELMETRAKATGLLRALDFDVAPQLSPETIQRTGPRIVHGEPAA